MSGEIKKDSYKPIIFIAEDIPRNLQVLCNMLLKSDYKISAAGNGRKALEMIPDVQPDLILLDIMMPELNGFQVAEELKKNPKTRDVPIIFLTAKADSNDIVRGLELGAVDYITKPFNGAELLSRVKTHLELKFARQKLKELNITKDKLFSIIAHDLKNPLLNSLLFSESLERNYDTYDDEKRKQYIHKIYSSTTKVSGLLENLLEWSTTHVGLMEANPTHVALHELVAENICLIKEHADNKDITLRSKVPADLTVFADKHMVRTVIRNLLSNAVKFTEPGGEVFVNALREEGHVETAVQDNGVGIAESDIEGIFKIDEQKIKLGTAKEKGTGLGLLICKEFVEKNNGSIEVVSSPAEGSCFKFRLPSGTKSVTP